MTSGDGFLLDTDFLSDTYKPRVNPGLMRFLSANVRSAMFLSVLSLGELRKAIVNKRKKDPVGELRVITVEVKGAVPNGSE